jgi:hypothetical protein
VISVISFSMHLLSLIAGCISDLFAFVISAQIGKLHIHFQDRRLQCDCHFPFILSPGNIDIYLCNPK